MFGHFFKSSLVVRCITSSDDAWGVIGQTEFPELGLVTAAGRHSNENETKLLELAADPVSKEKDFASLIKSRMR